ncbi:hypothetical protein Tdes44962_MAKER01045 [Teratosphaeria destructans]|uniref:DUF7598 domain-containing protein n=1 Tax=Teratosphaeria destructans TaxID=418781 RepID=A0A9W7SIB4_9PEZI|nr:hypothetical protein Tdes44962_MAKER01045 [Teratosphaeria destructans]
MFLRLWRRRSEHLPGLVDSSRPVLTRGHRLLYLPFETDRYRAGISDKTTKMTLSPKNLAGPGYIILNCIRGMNIIGLLAVIAASVAMLVKTSVASKFFFFDAVTHVLTAIMGMFLMTSEMSLFRGYFARSWPLLSPSHGFVSLALTMIALGITMLANLNKDATSQKSLGMPFWRMVIASGIVIFILGFVNLIASYVFRDRKNGITARQVRAHGAVAIHKAPMTSSTSHGTPPAPELAQSHIPNPITTPSPKKNFPAFRILTSERRDSTSELPSYHSNNSSPVKSRQDYDLDTAPVSPSSKYSRTTNCTKKVFSWMGGRGRNSLAPPLPLNISHTTTAQRGLYGEKEMDISAPMGVNPQFAHLVQRPDSALHPSRTGESEAFRWRANV